MPGVRRGILAATVVLVVMVLAVPAALARSTVQLSYPTTVQAGKQFVIAVRGDHDPADCGSGCSVNVFVLPPQQSCGDSSADTEGLPGARRVINTYEPADGQYAYSVVVLPLGSPGVYTVCGFIDTQWHNPPPIENPAGTLTVTRGSGRSSDPSGGSTSLKLSFPAAVSANQNFSLTASGHDDAGPSSCGPKCSVNVFILPPGDSCGTAAMDELGTSGAGRVINTYLETSGDFTHTVLVSYLRAPGLYSVCGYADDQRGHPPVATVVGTLRILASPPLPCIVPQYGGMSASQVIDAIEQGDCTVGALTLAASATIPAGNVLDLSPVPGTALSRGAPVDLTVSTGLTAAG